MITELKILAKRVLKPTKHNRLLFANSIFQRILGINKEFPLSVHYTTQLSSPQNIKFIGGINTINSFNLSGNCYFAAYNGIIIGDNVLFAPGVKIISSNHDFSNIRKPIPSEPIELGANTWIGTNASILPNVKIGEGCIIGAGAVVTKSFPDRCMIVGNPARMLYRICVCGGKLKAINNRLVCTECDKVFVEVNEKLLDECER